MKSKFSWVSWFPSCSRSDGSLEPVTSSFPAASDSLRANSHSSAVVQPVRPLTRSLSPVRVLSGKARGHRANQQQSTRPTYDPGWKFIPGNRRALSSLYKSLPLPAPARESAVFAPASPCHGFKQQKWQWNVSHYLRGDSIKCGGLDSLTSLTA